MDNKMNFADILASTLHDTKNSLGVLLNNIDDIIVSCREKNCDRHEEFYAMQYEIQRLNNSLIRLLSLYKAEKSQLSANIDYQAIEDVLDEVATTHEILLNSRGIHLYTESEEGLFWAFDRNLVAGVLDNVINNAFRYAQNTVKIRAFTENGYLVLQIEDDGRGYPPSMLINENKQPEFKQEIDFKTGSTGLGLYFSLMVAGMHVNNDKKGFISVMNGGSLGGGIFSIYLP
ncbi:MAG TPA: HAMP domain-containing sensor histidine kinase [Smithellaceae bacterium]|jgi:K+-sensing histidine kinase KdpD|nr:HAMP domain-containing sensor histidine kinase [Smithellaceae bacterium]